MATRTVKEQVFNCKTGETEIRDRIIEIPLEVAAPPTLEELIDKRLKEKGLIA